MAEVEGDSSQDAHTPGGSKRAYRRTLSPTCYPPRTSRSQLWKRNCLANAYDLTLDKVNTLDRHSGCVNALSWAEDGRLLLSGGDDTTVCFWRLDQTDSTTPYPFACQSVIHTGHSGNIFNAQMLPFSSRIVTVAGDRQVRVFDTTNAVGRTDVGGPETHYDTRDSCIRTLRCHTGRTKRIVTEESSDLFLTVGEDGTVRQHDLRVPHRCPSGCSPPLVKLHRDMSTIALSPLRPYNVVVAGESPYGYLFDRRHAGRFLEEEWGIPPNQDEFTTCVRKFGRPSRGNGERKGYEHVTGARMSSSNGHEVLLSYSSDAVYLYSTQDTAEHDQSLRCSPSSQTFLPPNPKRRRVESETLDAGLENIGDAAALLEDIEMIDIEDSNHVADFTADADSDGAMADESDDVDEEFAEEMAAMAAMESPDDSKDPYTHVPIILPYRRFSGHCNVETVKDVNFLGPDDEFVASGSDDGNFFVWRKATGALYGIYEADDHVVNVIEGHPHLPLVAVSGIDTTVKLFSPVQRDSEFSKMGNAESIMNRNREAASRRVNLGNLFLRYRLALNAASGEEGEEGEGCTFQ